MEGGASVMESIIVTACILLFFTGFYILSGKAEKEIDRYNEERLKSVKKSR